MRWIGIARAVDTMCGARGERRSRGQAARTRQIIQAWIAERGGDRLLGPWSCTPLYDRHKGFAAAREQVSLIKFHVADVMLRVVDRAIQVHGALGITSDTVLAHYYVHERGARIYDGPDEVHKMVVAKRILGRYGLRRDGS